MQVVKIMKFSYNNKNTYDDGSRLNCDRFFHF